MTTALHPTSRDRLLAIVPPNAVSEVLLEQTHRPVVALLTAHGKAEDPMSLEQTIVSLLDNGCEYFVCFGLASEALHDRIDELIVERDSGLDRTVTTTWHDRDTPTEVAEFFFNIAAANRGSLLVAALTPKDSELANLLAKYAMSHRQPGVISK